MESFPSICAACGAELAPETYFCGDCGARVEGAPSPSTPLPLPPSTPPPAPEPPAAPPPAFPAPADPTAVPPPPAAEPLPEPVVTGITRPEPLAAPGLPYLPAFGDGPTLAEAEPDERDPTAPGASEPGRRLPVPAIVGIAVAALAIVTILIVSFAESDRDAPGGAATSATAATSEGDDGGSFTEFTTPLHNREEFVAAVVAADPGLGVGATPEESVCIAGAIVDGLGGPEALQDESLTPERFAALESFLGIETPPTAADTFLAAVAACGADPTEIFVIRPVAATDVLLAACVGERIDRTVANRSLAEFFYDAGAVGDLPPALEGQLQTVTAQCLGG